VRGGGPALSEKLLGMLLEKKQLRGSTGVIMMQEGKILFYPTGSEAPSVSRTMTYEKKN